MLLASTVLVVDVYLGERFRSLSYQLSQITVVAAASNRSASLVMPEIGPQHVEQVDDPRQHGLHGLHRLVGGATGAEAVAVLGELPLEDRLQDVAQSCLHYPVPNCRYSQWPLFFAAWFGNPRSTHRSGTIGVFAQLRLQTPKFFSVMCREIFDRLVVDSRGSFLTQHFMG